jgi:hypothetical protein
MAPRLLPLISLVENLAWYENNVCNVELRDPRGFRVRFRLEHFIHLIKLTNKYGKEPKNRLRAIEDIRRGKLKFAAGRFNPQRASEVSWPPELVTRPDCICPNWQALGSGDEIYVKNFGSEQEPQYRVFVCKIVGETRYFSTLFPRQIKKKDLEVTIWP